MRSTVECRSTTDVVASAWAFAAEAIATDTVATVPGLHLALRDAAGAAGIELTLGVPVPWLSGRGHLNELVQEQAPSEVIDVLATIHERLGGDRDVLAAKRRGTAPTPDLICAESGCLVEVDEVQHFTSARLTSLDFYPESAGLGFDLEEYRALIERWKTKGDRAYAHKVSRDFPAAGGRQAQRAYNDALRDLLAPGFTGHPVIRIPVPSRALSGAVERLRLSLAQVGTPEPK